jgi:WD40 repeat protein
VSGDCEFIIRIWNFENLAIEHALKFHRSPVKQIAASRPADFLVSGGEDRVVAVWDCQSWKPRCSEGSALSAVTAVAVSGNVVASIHAEDALTIWNRDQDTRTEFLTDKTYSTMIRSPMGRWAMGFKDGSVRVYSQASEPPQADFREWSSDAVPIGQLAFDRIGSTLVTTHRVHGTLRFWDVDSSELTLIVPEASLGGNVESLQFHPHEPVLAVAGMDWKDGRSRNGDAMVAEWRRRTPAKIPVIETRQPFHPDGAIVLWDTGLWGIRQVLDGGARKIQFHPDVKFLAAISMDRGLLIWDHITGELLHDLLPSGFAIADFLIEPNGAHLVAVSWDGTIRVWDTARWKLRTTLEIDARMTCVTTTPESDFFWVGTTNGTILVFDRRKLFA